MLMSPKSGARRNSHLMQAASTDALEFYKRQRLGDRPVWEVMKWPEQYSGMNHPKIISWVEEDNDQPTALYTAEHTSSTVRRGAQRDTLATRVRRGITRNDGIQTPQPHNSQSKFSFNPSAAAASPDATTEDWRLGVTPPHTYEAAVECFLASPS